MAKQIEDAGTGVTERSSRRAPGGGKAAKSAVPKSEERGTARAGKAGAPRARGRTKEPDLKKDLRDFASARPQGWDHEDWLNFLESLKERGHDIADREMIGLALERERLDLALSKVKGVGPQKRQQLIERYGNIWSLRRADTDEIASVAGMTPALAERVKSELH